VGSREYVARSQWKAPEGWDLFQEQDAAYATGRPNSPTLGFSSVQLAKASNSLENAALEI